ncbi:unnamed protein product [Prorocentrum cordatum]|uniref:Endoribonuclease L-PSP/chorismate mutase-like domain-containing protein n=1 Tax=Prorocentrum cordatum TaxID=2364126 RepID=A0ABN9X4X1_9DINO|nr:unnamed protein product [Polarella glacialis]
MVVGLPGFRRGPPAALGQDLARPSGRRAPGAAMATAVEQRIAELGLSIPKPVAPVGSYLPWKKAGTIVYISGQIPRGEDNSLLTGTLGAGYSIDEGKAAARLCAINLIAQMKSACDGDLGKVKQILQVQGFVNSSPDFTDHPQVINGCSELLVEVFGKEVGSHSRFAVGNTSLPLGVAVEIGAVIEVE